MRQRGSGTRPNRRGDARIRAARAGLARRDVRRFDHVTLMRGASRPCRGHQYACGPLAWQSRLRPHSAPGNPCQVVAVTLSWRFGSLSCGRNGERLALPTLARAWARP